MVMKDKLTTASLIAAVLVLMLTATTEAQMAKEGDLSGTYREQAECQPPGEGISKTWTTEDPAKQ